MKNSKSNLPVKAEPLTPEVMPPLGDIEEPDYTKPGERINFHLGMARHHGRLAIAHIIWAGWELAIQKRQLGYGAWASWCKNCLECSQKSADRYVQFYGKTIGERRAGNGIPLATRLTHKEVDTATVGMDGKSVRAAMIDLNIIAKPDPEKKDSWGGKRVGAGHPKKNKDESEAKEEMVALDEIAETPASAWATVRDHLRPLQDAQRDHHVIDHLNLVELAEAHSILKSLCSDAEAALKRLEKV